MPRRISENYYWFEVFSPLIPNDEGMYKVAALHEDQATTIISKKFKIQVYVDDEKTSIRRLGPVEKSEKKVIQKQKTHPEISEDKLLPEEKICPSCGCTDSSNGSDSCPNCEYNYPERWYSIFEESKHVIGEL